MLQFQKFERAKIMSEIEKPNRMFMDDPDVEWRQGKPEYSIVDKLYLEGNYTLYKKKGCQKCSAIVLWGRTFPLQRFS